MAGRVVSQCSPEEFIGLPPALLEDARLLVSELVSNSVRHAELGPEDQIRVRAEWSGTRLRAVVSDGPRNSGHVIVVGSIRPDPSTESGWGLFLVDELADRWGTDIDEVVSYWFEIGIRQDPGSV
jgi:anti-sigma regulatory factor (Ser/Thr protein kinase)